MADINPLDALDMATAEYRMTEAAHTVARVACVGAVVAALKAGERPTDVVEHAPFTDAYVRRIAREHGIEPRRKGQS
jgi:hypothetical protein